MLGASSALADGLAESHLAEGRRGLHILEAVDGVQHALRVVLLVLLLDLVGEAGLLRHVLLFYFELVEHQRRERYVVLVYLLPCQEVLELVLQVLNLVHEEDVIAEVLDDGVHLLE